MQFVVAAEVTRLKRGDSRTTASLPRLLPGSRKVDCIDPARNSNRGARLHGVPHNRFAANGRRRIAKPAFRMTVFRIKVVASFLLLTSLRAADATTPVDYTQRNGPFAPGATIPVEKKILSMADSVQGKRVETHPIEKIPAAVGDRRAAIDMTEAQPKTILPKDSHRPEAIERRVNAFNHREAAITTAAEAKRPPTVAKYQDSLSAASATNMARFPAVGRATTAKINRFVFRKNGADASLANAAAAVTPAAGGSPVVK